MKKQKIKRDREIAPFKRISMPKDISLFHYRDLIKMGFSDDYLVKNFEILDRNKQNGHFTRYAIERIVEQYNSSRSNR